MDTLTKIRLIEVINKHLYSYDEDELYYIIYTLLCHFNTPFSKEGKADDKK